jgi:hypothetical protein
VAPLRSGQLAAWASAWLAGHIGSDDVVDAVQGADAPHRVRGLDGDDAALVALPAALIEWRRRAAAVRLVLPVAGDVRGVPGPVRFRAAALDAGEGVFGGGLGLVPEVTDHSPSSAPPTVVWQAFRVDQAPPDPLPLGEAQYDLTTAIRESAAALHDAEVAGGGDTVALQQARRAGELLDLPPGFPPRAVALLAQAERLQAVLDLADADPLGGAVDSYGVAARVAALRPLATAVRRARLAGYNAGVGNRAES